MNGNSKKIKEKKKELLRLYGNLHVKVRNDLISPTDSNVVHIAAVCSDRRALR